MRPNRFGAIASFVLTVQFLLTLWWIVVSWPASGVSGLAYAMAEYFRARIDEPVTFALLNLFNVSFAVSALAVVVVLRRQFSEFPLRMDFVHATVAMAAALYIASGVVPLVAAGPLLEAGDESALNAIEGIGSGLLLGGTMATGIALIVFGWIGFSSKRLPVLLCALMMAAGLIETVEWASNVFLVLDPILGTTWSFWLGSVLWANRAEAPVSGRERLAFGEGTIR